MLKRISCIFLVISLSGCAGHKVIGTDPLITWDSVITDCTGAILSDPVTYNVYGVPGPGPIPTSQSIDTSPCGVINLATGSPLNSTPITGTSYHAVVPDGLWTFGVEAIGMNGGRSGLSGQATKAVLGRPGVVGGVVVE